MKSRNLATLSLLLTIDQIAPIFTTKWRHERNTNKWFRFASDGTSMLNAIRNSKRDFWSICRCIDMTKDLHYCTTWESYDLRINSIHYFVNVITRFCKVSIFDLLVCRWAYGQTNLLVDRTNWPNSFVALTTDVFVPLKNSCLLLFKQRFSWFNWISSAVYIPCTSFPAFATVLSR